MAFPVDLLLKCRFLAGPTASGKTAVSLHLAQQIDAEIVALDSMTLYRGMDIGTAKPSLDERSRVRHHLIDLLDPHQEFSIAEYLDAAEIACLEIISRGHTPLFVGGTGLYLRSLLRGVFDGPSADWTIRHRLEEQERHSGSGTLHDQLVRIDPKTALRLHPNDRRRIIRALEVFELTGKPLSSLQQNGPRPECQRPGQICWLSPPRDWLYQRIDLRVTQMFEEGLIEEVARLLERPAPIGQTARQGLGYKEVIDWFEADPSYPDRRSGSESGMFRDASTENIRDLAACIRTRTRQFAKRQHTWFRNLEECHPVLIDGTETPRQMAELIAGLMDPRNR